MWNWVWGNFDGNVVQKYCGGCENKIFMWEHITVKIYHQG